MSCKVGLSGLKWEHREGSGLTMFFFGTFYHNLDDKSRFTIPSKFRDAIGSKIFITKGFDKCLYIYPEETFMKIAERYSHYDDLCLEERQNSRVFFATSMDYDIDKAGRVTLSKDHILKGNIQKEIIIIGRNDHLEIWDKATYEECSSIDADNFEKNASKISESRKKVVNV